MAKAKEMKVSKPVESPPPMHDLGPKPELRWIKLTELYVDHAYQRNAKTKNSLINIAYIQERFSWAYCGALVVCHIPEKKQYAVVDGQHRLIAALARKDIPELPCVVITGHDLKKQAKSFIVVNERRVKLHNLNVFHASVAAGDPDAVSLMQILDDCQISVPVSAQSGNKTGVRETQCVKVLLNMLGKYSEKQIKWALSIIPDAYGDLKGMMRSSIIKALAEYIKLHPDTDRARMIDVLHQVDIEMAEKDARSYVGISGGSPTKAIIEMLERLYKNIGRKGAA